jgi:putative membrane protein
MDNFSNQILREYIREDEIRELETFILAQEAKTSAEIVPMVVASSLGSTKKSSLWSFGFFTLAFCFSFFYMELWSLSIQSGFIDLFGVSFVLSAFIQVALLFFGFLTSYCILQIQGTQIFFTQSHLRKLVEDRAELEFYRQGLHATQNRTGILIFISLKEKQAVILGDKNISTHFPGDAWNEVLHLLLKNLKQKQMKKAFQEACEKIVAIVAPHFPPSGDNPDELSNRLIIKE